MITALLLFLLFDLLVWTIAEKTAKKPAPRAEYPDPTNPFRKGAQ